MTLSQHPALSVKVMEIQTSADPSVFRIQGASVLNCQSHGNSNKRRRDHWYSEENQGHRSRRLPPCVASEWEERQKSRTEGLRSRLLLWRSSPQSMREDLENVYMLLFWFVGNGFQLALCNVSWLATRESVVFVPDSIVFAPWSVLLSDDDGGPRETRFMALTTQSFPIVSTCGFLFFWT